MKNRVFQGQDEPEMCRDKERREKDLNKLEKRGT